jgi:hypothetical protein
MRLGFDSKAGKSIEARIAMMAITTNNSISVKRRDDLAFVGLDQRRFRARCGV